MFKMCYFCCMSRLSIEITPEQHQKIKALAALQGKSIKEFILSKLVPTNVEGEEVAWSELEEFLSSRIKQAKDSPASSKTNPHAECSVTALALNIFQNITRNLGSKLPSISVAKSRTNGRISLASSGETWMPCCAK